MEQLNEEISNELISSAPQQDLERISLNHMERASR